jgi:hypothetical protein
MKIHSWRALLCVLAVTTIVASAIPPAYALQRLPTESGFSGDINLGVGALSYESNLIASAIAADVGAKTTSALTVAPSTKSVAFPMFSFEVDYTFGQSRTQLFLGTEIRDYLVLSHVFSLGVRHEAQDIGRFQAALLSTPAGSKVWQDPYVTGADRVSTTQTARGLQLEWDKALRTDFGIGFSTSRIAIDNEASGTALGLSQVNKDLLNRNGTAKKIDVHYSFRTGHSFVVPSLSYVDESYDGKAMANSGFLAGVTLIAPLMTKVNVIGNLSFGKMTSDTVNPVFGKKYDKTHIGIDAAVSYRNPFGLNHWTGSMMVGYFNDDNKIDFYDTNTTLVALKMRYDF